MLLAGAAELDHWAREVPAAARLLAQRFWPGPLTLILKRQPHVTDLVTSGQDTIGLRVPGHPVALALLAAFRGGIAAPSANRFGRISPTRADHVAREFGDELLVLDGGACDVGIESTIEPEESMFQLSVSPENAPDEAQFITVEFVRGIPVAIDGQEFGPAAMIET